MTELDGALRPKEYQFSLIVSNGHPYAVYEDQQREAIYRRQLRVLGDEGVEPGSYISPVRMERIDRPQYGGVEVVCYFHVYKMPVVPDDVEESA